MNLSWSRNILWWRFPFEKVNLQWVFFNHTQSWLIMNNGGNQFNWVLSKRRKCCTCYSPLSKTEKCMIKAAIPFVDDIFMRFIESYEECFKWYENLQRLQQSLMTVKPIVSHPTKKLFLIYHSFHSCWWLFSSEQDTIYYGKMELDFLYMKY